MKFFSFQHFYLFMTSVLVTTLVFGESEFGRYVAVFLLSYGILMINARVMKLIEKVDKLGQ